jgi:hypothetical protein
MGEVRAAPSSNLDRLPQLLAEVTTSIESCAP